MKVSHLNSRKRDQEGSKKLSLDGGGAAYGIFDGMLSECFDKLSMNGQIFPSSMSARSLLKLSKNFRSLQYHACRSPFAKRTQAVLRGSQ
jgi:hypothetical protein